MYSVRIIKGYFPLHIFILLYDYGGLNNFMARLTNKTRYTLLYGLLVTTLLVAGAATYLLPTKAHANPVQPHFNHFLSTNYNGDAAYDDNNPAGNSGTANANTQQYDNKVYPGKYTTYDQAMKAYQSWAKVSSSADRDGSNIWKQIGPVVGNVPGIVTYTGHPTTNSGRETALAISDPCTAAHCRVWVGSAGGGVWVTSDGLSTTPTWKSSSAGIPSNAIGSLAIDPATPDGKIVYVGTGEANGSSDSEAGVGLYKSTNYGATWSLVSGSIAVAKDRSIGSVAVDPTNAQHIFIGTGVARHGSSAVNGGRFTPPNAPIVGLYESIDGGKTFKLVFTKQSDTVNPGSPNGSDFFRGGVSKVVFDHTGLAAGLPSRVYFSVFDYGLYRQLENKAFEQVFASAGAGSLATSASSRTEFALAPMGTKLRIYLGDLATANADFYRVDDANVAAATLTDGVGNPGWTKLSNPTPGTPGYSSYNFCEGQCSYDMWVASPPGQPNTVWYGGSMQYTEIFTANQPSNGRSVMRSTNGGVNFTDMTNDSQTPPVGLHPDQHAVAFVPGNPNMAFMSSDGGLIRNDGTFVNASAQCAARGISGADLTDCQSWLSAIPTTLYSMNAGLADLQFQSVAVNPQAPKQDIIGGTQDNGTWAYTAKGTPQWFESVGGDGGQSLIDVGNPNVRMHTYYGPNPDVNFKGNDPTSWDSISTPLVNSGEAASFYIPLIGDPRTSGTMYAGLQHIWRTTDNGGQQAYLDANCSETGTVYNPPCGDWVPLGPDLTSATFGADKGGSYVVAIQRAAGDTSTMWSATRRGRLFISTNANATDPAAVSFTRIDTAAQPTRFISGIAVDSKNANHAYVSFSGYDAYTPSTTGHVFDVTYNPSTGTATWKDVSYNLGDQPITNVAFDSVKGTAYVSTDFGVARLKSGSTHWNMASSELPFVAVYGLTLSESGRVLYAATHGRGIWRLDL